MMFVVALQQLCTPNTANTAATSRHAVSCAFLGDIVPMTVTFLMLNLNRVDVYVVAVQFLSI